MAAAAAPRGAAASSDGEAEGLRRLRAEQAVARHRRGDHAVGDRASACRRPARPGSRPARVSSAASRAGMVPGGISGRAASWTSTMSGACGASASSPARTLSWRVAPPATGGRCGRPASAASIAVGVADRLQQRRRARPAPRRRGGSPACRRAAGTASASRRRTGCRSRPRPGWLRRRMAATVAAPSRSASTVASDVARALRIASAGVSVICPNRWASVIATPQSAPIELRADRPRRWRAHRHAGHPGADVGRHRSAVPPPRQAAWRRHGGLRDDRLLGDGPREPQDAARWPRWTAAAASARVQLAGCEPGGDGRGGAAGGGPRRRPDRHQFRLPGEEGGASASRPARR